MCVVEILETLSADERQALLDLLRRVRDRLEA